MLLNFDFNTLLSGLGNISEVVEDALVAEDLKNVIFKVSKDDLGDKLELIGYNNWITYMRNIPRDKVTISGNDKDEPVLFQVKSKELLSFLNSYSNLSMTKVEEVSFELIREGKILMCKVLEKDEDTNAQFISSWSFSTLPIKPTVLNAINIEKPVNDLVQIPVANIQLYTSNLMPILQPGTNLYSQLTFGDKFVVAFSQVHTSYMGNRLTAIAKDFCGIKLVYRCVAFMEKVICGGSEVVEFAKTPTHLYFETEDSCAFIQYDNRLPEYKMYLEMIDKESYISLNRKYLKDVLKRFSLLHDSIEVNIDLEKKSLHLKNSKFSQEVYMLEESGMERIEKRNFKIMPEVLSKAIIGTEDLMGDTVYLYFTPQANKKTMLTFSGADRSWLSVASIMTY